MGLLDQFNKLTSGAADQAATPVSAAPAPVPTHTLPDGTPAALESTTGLIGRFVLPDGAVKDAALSTAAPLADQIKGPNIDVPEPKKRGRPKKEAVTIDAAGPSEAKLVLPPDPIATEVRLYIGCAPIGVLTQTLHSYADDLEKSVLRTLEDPMPDVRLSSNDMLSYGKWKAVLAQAVIKSPPPPGHYIVPGIPGEKTQVVVDALLGTCARGTVVLR